MTELTNFINNISLSTLIPLIMAGGGAVWFISQLKTIIHTLKNFIVHCISFTIYNSCIDERNQGGGHYSFTEKQQFFDLILTNAKTLWERTKNLDFTQCSSTSQYTRIKQLFDGKTSETLTYGFSIKILFGKLIFCERYIDNTSQKIVIKTNIRVFFANKQKFIDKLNTHIDNLYTEYQNLDDISDYVIIYNNDNIISTKFKRNIESIFMNNNEQYDLYNDIEKFINNKNIYKKINYPYKYCALLHGVPGSGKSSTLLAIASKLNRHVDYINLSDITISQLLDKISWRSDKSIFVFEDIDALKSGVSDNRSADQINNNSVNVSSKLSSTISLSDLLNITDGLLSNDGTICLFTTNHIEKLDPALLRPGRMNKIIEFKYLNSETANKMIKAYLDVEIENLKSEIKPAELQEMILNIKVGKKTIDDLKNTFQNI